MVITEVRVMANFPQFFNISQWSYMILAAVICFRRFLLFLGYPVPLFLDSLTLFFLQKELPYDCCCCYHFPITLFLIFLSKSKYLSFLLFINFNLWSLINKIFSKNMPNLLASTAWFIFILKSQTSQLVSFSMINFALHIYNNALSQLRDFKFQEFWFLVVNICDFFPNTFLISQV